MTVTPSRELTMGYLQRMSAKMPPVIVTGLFGVARAEPLKGGQAEFAVSKRPGSGLAAPA